MPNSEFHSGVSFSLMIIDFAEIPFGKEREFYFLGEQSIGADTFPWVFNNCGSLHAPMIKYQDVNFISFSKGRILVL